VAGWTVPVQGLVYARVGCGRVGGAVASAGLRTGVLWRGGQCQRWCCTCRRWRC